MTLISIVFNPTQPIPFLLGVVNNFHLYEGCDKNLGDWALVEMSRFNYLTRKCIFQ